MTRSLLLGRFLRGPSQRTVTVWLLIALATALVTVALATGAAAQSGPQFGARPAPIGGATRSSAIFTHAIETGSELIEGVEVLNFGDQPATIDVYAVDMVRSSDGSLAAAARSAERTGTVLWFTMEVASVTVPPRSSEIVNFTVDVPIGTPPGEYHAAVAIEAQPEPGSSTIQARSRIALPVKLTVLGEINLGVSLSTLSVHRTKDFVELTVDVSNTGDVTFETSAAIEITDWGGSVSHEAGMEPEGVFVPPGGEVTLRARWPEPPSFGRFDAVASADVIVGPRAPQIFVSDPVRMWFIPWIGMFQVLLLAMVLGWLLHATRSSRAAWLARKRQERQLVRDFRNRQHPNR